MVELMDDEQWAQEIGDAFYGDAEIDDDGLEEYDVTQNQPLDEFAQAHLKRPSLRLATWRLVVSWKWE